MSDSETENVEIEVWIYFSCDCGYITIEESEKLLSLNDETGKLIWHIIHNPEKYM